MKFTFRYILCTLVRICIDALGRLVFGLKNWSVQSITLPPVTSSLLTESASSLAQKIRTKKVSCEVVITAFIERIKDVNPVINAVVDFNFEEALKEARAVDQFLSSCILSEVDIAGSKPFLGVPFTAKDCFSVKGLRQTSGLYARKDYIADEDAIPIMLMKQAGAIVIGVTNVAELCMWWESSNTIYGRTKNPFDTRRTAGGSSGGEGSIIAACGSPLGIGTDIGGSIRIPSFFNGIFGHKPTTGIVSNAGQIPVAKGELDKYLVTGPMCKFAGDLKPMYKVLAASNVDKLSLDKQVKLKNLKVYYMVSDGGDPIVTPVDREIKKALHRVLDYFEKSYEIIPVKLHIEEFINASEIMLSKLGGDPESNTLASELTQNQGEINVWTEVLKWLFGFSKHTAPALYFAYLEKSTGGKGKSPSKYNMKLNQSYENLKRQLLSTLGEDGILLYPCHPTPAFYHSQSFSRLFDCGYTGIFNIIGAPVTQCPLGLNAEGLPLGIQVVGNKYMDHLCLAVAEELERAFGGWVCPSQIQSQTAPS